MNPFQLFDQWISEAQASEPRDANAAALATATPEGVPHVRYVLIKDHGPEGFTVYTNTGSLKGTDMDANPRAALAIHWKSSYRQVRIEGRVERVSDAEADAYFASRGRDKQLAASASLQSRPLPDRQVYLDAIAELDATYAGREVPRPAHWTGYRIRADRIEFWEGREDRMHHRLDFRRDAAGQWTSGLLYP